MISLRGPLCAGEAFSLRPRGRGGVVSHGETWGPGRNSFLVPSPHISPLCWLRQKGGPFPIFHVRTYTALKAPDVTFNRTNATTCESDVHSVCIHRLNVLHLSTHDPTFMAHDPHAFLTLAPQTKSQATDASSSN